MQKFKTNVGERTIKRKQHKANCRSEQKVVNEMIELSLFVWWAAWFHELLATMFPNICCCCWLLLRSLSLLRQRADVGVAATILLLLLLLSSIIELGIILTNLLVKCVTREFRQAFQLISAKNRKPSPFCGYCFCCC